MDLHRARNYQGTLLPWAPCVSATLVGLRESRQSSNVFPISSLDAIPASLPPCLPNRDPSVPSVIRPRVLIFPTTSSHSFIIYLSTSNIFFQTSKLCFPALQEMCSFVFLFFFLESETIGGINMWNNLIINWNNWLLKMWILL